MKKITMLVASVVSMTTLFSQAVLPTNWDSSGNPPTGWAISGTTSYTGSGNPLPAIRFDNTGDYVQIDFSDSPGLLTYDIVGNPPTGSSFSGTYTIQESVDGTSWTTLAQHTTLPTVYTPMSATPLSSSRHIRFYFTAKATGNVGLDNVNIALPVAGPNQEIDVLSGTTRIPSNGTAYVSSPVSSTTPFSLIIKNEGLVNTLNISNAVITGADASSFTITSTPSTVSASSQANLDIDFSPLVAGTHMATLTISSDDSDEATYIVNLYGIGGNFATEPGVQPSNLTFSNIKSFRYKANLTPAASDGYIVLRKSGSAVTDVPTDGTVYSVGDGIGTSKVAYIGSGTAFIPKYILAGTTDHFAIFAYNGPSTFVNFLTASPLTGSVTTLSSMMPAGEYASLNSSSASFVSDLTALINPHNQILYGDYQRTIIKDFYERDTTNGQKVVSCVYSNYQHIYTAPMDFSVISREHSICQSWMLTVNDPNYDSFDEYQDYHNLFPVHQNNANAVRSNHPLGEVVNVTSTFLEGKYGTDANGITVYEPRDSQKGDAARAMFYMMVSYNGTLGNWGFDNLLAEAMNQNQDLLRQWHYNDPPNGLEIARNDYIDSLQGNRNPFIDSADFVCYINFANIAKTNLNSPCLVSPVGLKEISLGKQISVYPNPTKAFVEINSGNAVISEVEIFDISGKSVRSVSVQDKNYYLMNTEELNQGTYLIKIKTNIGTDNRKLVIQ